MYDNTSTICMISYVFIWYHIHSLQYPTMLWHSHTLYSYHHTQDIYDCIHCSYYLQCIDYITTVICVISNPLYVWQHMNSMWHQKNSLWHRKAVFMTSHPHSSWHHTHYIQNEHTLYLWHHSHCNYDKTPTLFLTLYSLYMTTMTRHLLCFWHYTHCIWHLTQWMNDNTTTVSDMIADVSV